MSEPTDLESVRRCLEGEVAAFEEIIRRYERPVLNLAYRIVRNQEDARDVAQSVFIKAYAKLSAYDPRFKFFSWLYRIAVNESINFAAKRDRRAPSGPDWAAASPDPAAEMAAAEERGRFEMVMGSLAPGQRALLALSAEGLSYREMAATLGLPERKVKSRLFAARDRMRELVGREGRQAHD
ncbi:MAG: sigma-70 family RNA polymerase sigma factor [Candidatus Aminicenantes bacterium]|nr:sigma-70 family RNA polymerase sigma factor [Candidatus Aminicenantes bacterium]